MANNQDDRYLDGFNAGYRHREEQMLGSGSRSTSTLGGAQIGGSAQQSGASQAGNIGGKTTKRGRGRPGKTSQQSGASTA
jgi:hypothetical protein